MYRQVDRLLDRVYKEFMYKAGTMTFGEQLKAWRLSLEMTQAQFGEALGVEQQTVSGWEANKNWPSAARLRLLADRLGVAEEEMAVAYFRFLADANMEALTTVPPPAPPAPEVDLAAEVMQLRSELREMREAMRAGTPRQQPPPATERPRRASRRQQDGPER